LSSPGRSPGEGVAKDTAGSAATEEAGARGRLPLYPVKFIIELKACWIYYSLGVDVFNNEEIMRKSEII
jgi:hypothetical protein